ncbi:MAG: YedE family putative selenium transporter [Clostridia bacterium]|nr:YedE family putative selenium transporter [Clostridia bacterium]
MKDYIWIIIAGLITGVAAIVLSALGNPGNMGFCIACFLRDITGGIGLQSKIQYIRPEIIGLILGSTIFALIRKEFKPKGGSSPFLRFILGNIVMIGSLMFLGCPLRMVIRLGGGDLNAIVGLVGFIFGILVGILFIKKGFSLGRAYKQTLAEGIAMPVVALVLFVMTLVFPALFFASAEGPGSMHAPIIVSLVLGLVVGALAQRSRLCFVGGVRDVVMFKDFKLIIGFVGVLVAVLIGNAIMGNVKFSFEGQAIAHTDGIWNFLGMTLVGWASLLLGGCPLRQLILSGEGNSDSAITVVGMVFGAALCHNFGLASSGEGPTSNGMIAVVIGFVIVLLISLLNLKRGKK